jgi:hypothetical protein
MHATAPRDLLAVLLILAAAYHLAHLARHAGRRDVDVVHAAMGAAMAVMLLRGAGTTTTALLLGGFAAATVWFGARALDGRPGGGDLRQALCCVAMLAMLALAGGPSGGMAGMPGMAGLPGMAAYAPSHPALLLLLAAQLGLVLWTALDSHRVDGRRHTGAQLATTLGGAWMVGLML